MGRKGKKERRTTPASAPGAVAVPALETEAAVAEPECGVTTAPELRPTPSQTVPQSPSRRQDDGGTSITTASPRKKRPGTSPSENSRGASKPSSPQSSSLRGNVEVPPDAPGAVAPGAVAVAGMDSRASSKQQRNSTATSSSRDLQLAGGMESPASPVARSNREGPLLPASLVPDAVAVTAAAMEESNVELGQDYVATTEPSSPRPMQAPGASAVAGTGETQDAAAVHKDPRARARSRRERNSTKDEASKRETETIEKEILKDVSSGKVLSPGKDTEKVVGPPLTDSSDILDKTIRDQDKDKSTLLVAGATPPESALGTPLVTAAPGIGGAPEPMYDTTGGGFGGPGYTMATGDERDFPVAIQIPEDGEDRQFLPSAIEYDPDAKPPLVKNRRFRLYLAVGVCLLIDIIVAVVVIVVLKSDGPATLAPSIAPSLSPSTSTEGLFREQFAAAVGSKVYVENTHQWYASEWILHEDPRALSRDDPSLIQRYLLALFYMTTTNNGEHSWRSCNRPGPDDDDSCEFQRISLNRDDTIEFLGEPAHRWLSGVHECLWAGNLCDDVQFTRAIELFAQNITGTLPTELVAFPYLQSIALGFNEFTGTLPPEYASMRHLLNLEVHGNMLTGSVPPAYYTASALQNLNLGENIFEGSISTEMGQLTNIKGLHLNSNFFTGTLPTELANMEFLSFTRLHDNLFQGKIPTEFGLFGLLQECWMQTNQLTGPIPSELGLMEDMTDLGLYENMLTGTIPEELFSFGFIFRLDLFNNQLSGTLSTRVGNLTKLEQIRVSDNRLTGTIPLQLANITTLELAWLHLNEFVGDMPLAMCDRRPFPLQFLQTDCHPEGLPSNGCECCTACCDRATELCQVIEGA